MAVRAQAFVSGATARHSQGADRLSGGACGRDAKGADRLSGGATGPDAQGVASRLIRGSRRLRLAIALVLAVAISFGLWRAAGDWRALPLESFHLDLPLLAASWLVQTAGWLIVVDAWRRIVEGVAGAPIGVAFGRHLEAHTLSALGNVLPGSVWLPASRLALYRRLGVGGLAVSVAVAVEWLVIGLAGIALYGAAVPFSHFHGVATAPALAAAVVAAAAALHPRTLSRLAGIVSQRFGSAVAPDLTIGDTVSLVGRETLVLSLSGAGLYLLMRATTPASSLADALAAWGLAVAVANLLAWVPATLVLKDGIMALALTPLYGSAVLALSVVVLWRVWMTLVLVSWAAIAIGLARRAPVADVA